MQKSVRVKLKVVKYGNEKYLVIISTGMMKPVESAWGALGVKIPRRNYWVRYYLNSKGKYRYDGLDVINLDTSKKCTVCFLWDIKGWEGKRLSRKAWVEGGRNVKR